MLIFLSICSLYSCSPQFYIPHGTVSPELSKKGDVYLEGKLNSADALFDNSQMTSVVGAVGYGITDQLGSYVKGSLGKNESSGTYNNLFGGSTTEKIDDQINDVEIGIGYFDTFGANGVFDFYLVNALGDTNSDSKRKGVHPRIFGDGTYTTNGSQNIQTNYHYIGLQSKFGVQFKKLGLSLNNRVGSLNYYNIKNTSIGNESHDLNNKERDGFVFGQDVKLSYGQDYKIFLQGGYFVTQEDRLAQDKTFASFGVSCNFNALKKNRI